MSTQQLAADLALIGLTFQAPCEDCACPACKHLDRSYDVDAIAIDSDGRSRFVAHREQGTYDYRTITVRSSSDRGNPDVQARKLFDGRSRADIYVQSYPSGVAWALPVDLRATMHKHLAGYVCPEHEQTLNGSGGQTFLVFCQWCTAMHYVPRVPAALPSVEELVW